MGNGNRVTKYASATAIITAVAVLLIVAIACGIASFVVVENEMRSKSTINNTQNDNTFGFFDEGCLSCDGFDECFGSEAKVYPQKNRSGVVIEQSSRRVLADEGMRTRCYPASTTKVLTALTALNNCDVEKVFTIPKEAVGIEGSSIYLKEGEKLTIEELLYGMMLRSGNDSATAVAIATSGSVEKFVDLMNETARECGALESNFVNPHGLNDDNHYTNAYDLALITAKAYENELFRRIVSTRTAKISGEEADRYIGNKNKLLSMYAGANGVKTGYTKKSGRCLVGGAQREGMQLISVVLNYNDMWNDTMRLLDSGFDNYELKPVETASLGSEEGKTVIRVKAEYDEKGRISPYYYPLKKDGSEIIKLYF